MQPAAASTRLRMAMVSFCGSGLGQGTPPAVRRAVTRVSVGTECPYRSPLTAPDRQCLLPRDPGQESDRQPGPSTQAGRRRVQHSARDRPPGRVRFRCLLGAWCWNRGSRCWRLLAVAATCGRGVRSVSAFAICPTARHPLDSRFAGPVARRLQTGPHASDQRQRAAEPDQECAGRRHRTYAGRSGSGPGIGTARPGNAALGKRRAEIPKGFFGTHSDSEDRGFGGIPKGLRADLSHAAEALTAK